MRLEHKNFLKNATLILALDFLPSNFNFISGIPIIKDLAVGENLLDHLVFVGLSYKINETVVHNIIEDIFTLPQYLFTGKGPLTSIGKKRFKHLIAI